ncbi:Hypothetical predicted protein [Paramuricea clavata]|uniref:Uncharacterized protein n=1 Tax=Paramuricea clavata TaxID=317549 RepID=A0A6S7I7P9_PARCT|nr:Hypothetical predicted protein [Paramuricea clavata]
MSAANFTQVTRKLNELFLTNEYRSDIMTAFNLRNWSELTCGQRILGAQLLFHLYQMCVAEISKSVLLNEEEESHALKVSDMGPDGRGKIWYLGGWATHKLLEKSRRYVVENRYSTSQEVLDKVVKEMKKVLVLELYHDIVLRYLRMGVGQFLRDFRKDYKLKKSLAHRKAVLQKKEKANVKKMKVHMPQIEQDKSSNKQLSHLQLRALVGNIKAVGMRAM